MATLDDAHLTPYSELADLLDRLPLLLREARRARRLTTRAAGDQLHVAAATILRFEAGTDGSRQTAQAVLRWLDQGATTGEEPDRG
jgi:hypothetical protein